MSLAILVPVLDRPHRVKPLLDSIDETCEGATVLFICDPDDRAEMTAIRQDGRGEMIICEGGYAAKIAEGVRASDETLIFLGADDLEFQEGWLGAALARLKTPAGVVGVNDLLPRNHVHATHFLMTREYAEMPLLDGKPGPLCESYSHSFVDNELIATATVRGVYAYAEDSHVRHLHPDNGGAEWDETYRKGRELIRVDRRIFARRQHLWSQS